MGFIIAHILAWGLDMAQMPQKGLQDASLCDVTTTLLRYCQPKGNAAPLYMSNLQYFGPLNFGFMPKA